MSSNDKGPVERSDYNPFEAPRARVDDRPAPAPDGQLVDPPAACAAGRGAGWIGRGWGLFKGAPGTWVLIVLAWSVLWVVLSIIPIVNLVTIFIGPAFTAGLYFAAHSQMRGDGLEVGMIFTGFKRNFGALVKVGLWYLLGILIVVGVSLLMFGGVFGGLDALSGLAQPDGEASAGPSGVTILLFGLVVLGLTLPLVMAIVYAPILVLLHDLKALPAMVLSFRGCLRNVIPSLVFGIAALALTILALIPVGLGLLIMMPVMFAAVYISYREIFLGEKV